MVAHGQPTNSVNIPTDSTVQLELSGDGWKEQGGKRGMCWGCQGEKVGVAYDQVTLYKTRHGGSCLLIPLIPAPEKMRQENPKPKVDLGCTVNTVSQKKKKRGRRPALGRQMDLSEFKDSLVYIANSRTVREIQ